MARIVRFAAEDTCPGSTGMPDRSGRVMSSDLPTSLVLSGGNALGAYHAGVVQALLEANVLPKSICGGSAGAVTGAILAGNAPDQVVDRLAAFWRPGDGEAEPLPPGMDEMRRAAAVGWTLAMGQPHVFVPRQPFGWDDGAPGSLFDTRPLLASLPALLDFDRLNSGAIRFTATAVDIGSGEDVVFDTRAMRITPDHLRASCALMPAYQPVEIGGRLLGDAGLSANLPLDPALREAPAGASLCLAVDLLPLAGAAPRTLTEAAHRTQDLVFAAQSRRTIAAWQAIFDVRARENGVDLPSITLIHLVYAAQGREVAGKALDFSPASIRSRWIAGLHDARYAIEQLTDGRIEIGRPGLAVHRIACSAPDAPC